MDHFAYIGNLQVSVGYHGGRGGVWRRLADVFYVQCLWRILLKVNAFKITNVCFKQSLIIAELIQTKIIFSRQRLQQTANTELSSYFGGW